MPSKKHANRVITIDPGFKALIPPLTPDERANLERSILADGRARDPLVVWLFKHGRQAVRVLLDGHNRHSICMTHGLPFDVIEKHFDSREAARAWMLDHQRSRRNLSPDQMAVLHFREHGTKPASFLSPLEDLAALCASDLADSVLSGAMTFRIAVNHLKRRASPPRPYRPSKPRIVAEPQEPRDNEAILGERRDAAERRVARAEAKSLADELLEARALLDFVHAAPSMPPEIRTVSSRNKSGKRIATPVFLVSDTHFGETVTLAETLGTNEYNLEIAAQRMAKCWDNMLWLRDDMSRTQTCDDTLLVLNGDIVSGDIHDELRETNDGGLRDQCNAAVAAILPGIQALRDATPGVLHIVCIGGNHGRATHKQHIKNGNQHSIEHIGVYDPLRRLVGDCNGKVSWHVPKAERHIMNVHGYRISSQHGTMIRSQGGIGGTLVPMTRWVTRANDADLYLFGHFHEADAYGKIVKNGALIGDSAYTKWLGIESRPPEQVAFVIDSERLVRRFERVSVT